MLQLRKVINQIEEVNLSDWYIITKFSFHGKNTTISKPRDDDGILYWFTNDYFEIGLDYVTGWPFKIVLIRYSKVYQLEKKLNYSNAQQICGFPTFKTRRWPMNRYGDPESTREHEDRDLELYLEKDALTIIFFPHPIKFMINNKRVSFGFDNNKALCLIRITNYDTDEMQQLREWVEHTLTITKESITYLPLTLTPDYMVQLGDIEETVSTQAIITINDNSLMSIIFENTNNEDADSVEWSIDESITIVLDHVTKKIMRIDLSYCSQAFRINQQNIDHSAFHKTGIPLFKTYALKDNTISDYRVTDPCSVYLQDDSIRIALTPHPVAMTIQSSNIIFGFNKNKSLCSITVANLSEQEIACLEYILHDRKLIVDATNDAINYALVEQGLGTTLQLKDIHVSVKEVTHSQAYQPMEVLFSNNQTKQQDLLYWRLNNFFEMALDRLSGTVISFKLQRYCSFEYFSTPRSFQHHRIKQGLPSFKTIGWLEDCTPSAVSYTHKVLYKTILEGNAMTIRFMPHIITESIVNNRVAFNFNTHGSLCSITVNDLTDKEGAQLKKSFNYQDD
jgi:hypothetical protein